MPRTTPRVENDALQLGPPGAEQTIAVGSPDWFAWVEGATAFTFVSPHGTYTARRERASSGRGGWYWRAYQRRAGVRQRAYIGRAAELTAAQLHAVAAGLAGVAASASLSERTVGVMIGAEQPLAVSALPSGTATFLFTDIEGSTQLWERHTLAMPAALARHETLLRQAIAAHDGVVFKTVGDSLHAAFARAPDALRAALAAQRALQQQAWELPTPLRVRMALHSGVAELREGDYFGPPLNRLARLLGLGHGGQILLSRAAHDLTVDDLPAGTSLRALGEHTLRDLTRPELIFQCVCPGLPADFPSLRTDTSRPGAATAAPQVLATKLYLPRTRSSLVARPRLFARLDAGQDTLLTLVCAPAGFGKTTLLAGWLRVASRPVAWLGLDSADSDLARFLSYLVAALQMLAPDVGAGLLGLLQAQPTPPPEILLTALLNDLSALPHKSVLVLDDYHVLQAPPIHAALIFLLDHLPPTLQLVIATREDPPLPLSRLRARGQLAEVRAADLHFTPEEADQFLGRGMGLQLPEGQMAALVARTEGWAAGLQLAALALRDREDTAGFVAAFAGSHRLVADYLASEVIDNQPALRRRFLLATSVLGRLCGPLCDALLRDADQMSGVAEEFTAAIAFNSQHPTPNSWAYSQSILEELDRTNLFLVPLDDERRWYRYHHLFADFLRQRLMQEVGLEAVNRLYRRAGSWFAQAGLLPEAIQYALAGGAFADAATWIEALLPEFFGNSAIHQVLAKWLAALPVPLVRARSRLCLGQAWLLLNRLELEPAAGWVDAAVQALPEDMSADTTHLRGAVLATRAFLATYGPASGLEEASAWLEQALADLAPEDAGFRSIASASLGKLALQQGKADQAERAFAESAAIGRSGGLVHNALAGMVHQINIQRMRGARRRALATSEMGLAWAAAHSDRMAMTVGALSVLTADLLRDGNDLAAALPLATEGLRALRQYEGGLPFVIIASLSMARLRLARGEVDMAAAALAAARPLAHQGMGAALAVLLDAGEAQIQLARGDAAAVAWATAAAPMALPELIRFGPPIFAAGVEALGVTAARILLVAGRAGGDGVLLQQAAARLETSWELAERQGWGWLRLEVLVLRSLLADSLGDRNAALAALALAVAQAEPEGYVRSFVDQGAPMAALLQVAQAHSTMPRYCATLLDAFPEQPEARGLRQGGILQASSLVEPLSARELEVLALMAEGLSNNEIAQRMIVSAQTVKVHTRNIYGKLDVNSRMQAVVKARAFGLLA